MALLLFPLPQEKGLPASFRFYRKLLVFVLNQETISKKRSKEQVWSISKKQHNSDCLTFSFGHWCSLSLSLSFTHNPSHAIWKCSMFLPHVVILNFVIQIYDHSLVQKSFVRDNTVSPLSSEVLWLRSFHHDFWYSRRCLWQCQWTSWSHPVGKPIL